MKQHRSSQEGPVRIGRISYMNVAPIYYGLDEQTDADWYAITSAPPAVLNRMMAAGELDISPVSTAAYADHQDEWLLLPNLSISCDGPVMSVVLASRFSIRELDGKRVVLSDESASAAALLRLFFKEHGIRPEIRCRRLEGENALSDADAVLVIGDAALNGKWQKAYRYVWDLCGAWKDATGLPFVFALWAVRKQYAREQAVQLARTFDILNRSRRKGCANLATITSSLQKTRRLKKDILDRYFNGLQYDLDAVKFRGLQAFYDRLKRYGLIPAPVAPRFIEWSGQDDALKAQGSAQTGPGSLKACCLP